MNVQNGDLIHLALDRQFDVIVHGCNCFCSMGAGIAKQIKEHFPQAYRVDQNTPKGDKKKLGTYTVVWVKNKTHTFAIINAYTQYDFSGTGVLVNYEAVRKIFAQIKKDFQGQRIAYPKIGAGLAKGDWEMITKIIDQELHGENHTFVEYNGHKNS